MSFEISKATPADASELLVTLEEARAFKLAQGDYGWGTEPFTDVTVQSALVRGETYIARIDGHIAGSLALSWEDSRIWGEDKGTDGLAGYIHRLTTRDSFRGQGVGRLLVAWAFEQVQNAERPYLRLDCSYKNPALCGYYETQGFEQIGRKDLTGPDYAVAFYQKSVQLG